MPSSSPPRQIISVKRKMSPALETSPPTASPSPRRRCRSSPRCPRVPTTARREAGDDGHQAVRQCHRGAEPRAGHPQRLSSSRSRISRKRSVPCIRRTASPRRAASAGEYCTRSPGSPMRSSSPIAVTRPTGRPAARTGPASASAPAPPCASAGPRSSRAACACRGSGRCRGTRGRHRRRASSAPGGRDRRRSAPRIGERLRHREDPEDVVGVGRATGTPGAPEPIASCRPISPWRSTMMTAPS